MRWHVEELQVHLELAADQQAAGADEATVRGWIEAGVRGLPNVQGVGLARAVTRTALAGVEIGIAWQRLDGADHPVAVATMEAGALVVQLAAHAECGGSGKSVAIAARSSQLVLPMPAGGLAADAWLRPRLQRAAAHAVADVLAELAAQRATDAQLIASLQTDDIWELSAAIREVGERRLVVGRLPLEKLARDTRKDVAIVALTALGRLGEAASLPVLRKACDGRHVESVVAALEALARLRTTAASEALRDIAATHESAAVRARAAALATETAP